MSIDFEPEEELEPLAPPAALELDTLLDLELRVWAELGRAHMPAAKIVGTAPGTIIDLDRAPEDPAEIFVNGRRLGSGRLLLVDGEWAIRIESVESDAVEIEQTSSDASAP
jgi:flagellar motor switch protein FliN/FliY